MVRGRRAAVTWSFGLVAIIVGGQVAALGFVAIGAAVPPRESVTLSYTQGTGAQIVQFTPAPAWGVRSLSWSLVSPCANHGGVTCVVGFNVRECTDVTCDLLGAFNATLPVWRGGSDATPSTTATTFLITLVDRSPGASNPVALWISTCWLTSCQPTSASPGVLAGGTTISLVAGWAVVAGLVTLVVGAVSWRYSEPPYPRKATA